MKALLLSCKAFDTKIKTIATLPTDIAPEAITKKEYKTGKCIVILVTVEDSDNPENIVPQLGREIRLFSKDTGIHTIVIYPFGHLSNKLAPSAEALNFLHLLEKQLTDFKTIRVHFGSHKSLLLDIYGHRGNVRFREF